jgi:hypothetical protein
MKHALVLAMLLLSVRTFAATPLPETDLAYDIVAGLTTEVGPRLAGTEAEARGRQWAVAKLQALGFSHVRIENFTVPTWIRGDERASVVAPYEQRLAITALGRSGATPATGTTAAVIGFASLDDLKSAPDAAVRDKIVYVSHAMRATQDGSSYEYFAPARLFAPAVAAQKGARAILVRSLGPDDSRHPHTGATHWSGGVAPIPAAALSNSDADNLERMLARSRVPVQLHLLLTPRSVGMRQSGNVIAEVPGTDPSAGLIAIGGHLDSWDLGTGALDDGAGVAIATAAAATLLSGDRPRDKPRRTVRLIWWGAEEMEPFGGRAYFGAHAREPHAVVAEADMGADRVWLLRAKFSASAAPVAKRLATALAPLGIGADVAPASEGEDIAEFLKAGVSSVALMQDLTRYFNYHHTADDTLNRVDPQQLRQCVSAWSAMLEIVANAPENLLVGGH